MQIYSQLRYSDPRAPEGSEHSFGWGYQPVLERRYGLTRLHVYYFKTLEGLEVDKEHMREKLAEFPRDVFVMLNLEGDAWEPCTQAGVDQQVLDARMELLLFAKELRPDLLFAYYYHPPSSSYERCMNFRGWWRERAAAQRELAEAQACIIPEFYFRRAVLDRTGRHPYELTAARAGLWASRCLTDLKELFPNTEIRPILWPTWHSWFKQFPASGGDGFDWTIERQMDSRVPADIWQAVLEPLGMTCDSFIIWGQGHCPWDAESEWFTTTLEWKNHAIAGS